MFRPLALWIGLCYTRAKKRNHFISFVSLVSLLGMALGVTVLITVLAVMNGFDYEIHNRVFSMARQVTISGGIKDWSLVAQEVKKNSDVVACAPFVFGQGMLTKDSRARGVVINGILPQREAQVSNMAATVTQGAMAALQPGSFGIVLGWEIAADLNVGIGDKVVLLVPNTVLTPIGVEPRFKRFTVVGIFHVGEGFGYDASMTFINLYDAQKLFTLGDKVTGLHLKIKNLYQAPLLVQELLLQFHDSYNITDWTREYGSFFQAIRMEKTTMFVVLLFIIAIAAFNLVSGLVMTVTDKQADIAILRTFGASPRLILSIFMIQGGIIGFLGTLLGVIGGILLAVNAPDLVKLLEQILRTHFISAGVYFIDYLPSRLLWQDIWHVGLSALVMSLLATIYPAWRAAKIQPAEALRYE